MANWKLQVHYNLHTGNVNFAGSTLFTGSPGVWKGIYKAAAIGTILCVQN